MYLAYYIETHGAYRNRRIYYAGSGDWTPHRFLAKKLTLEQAGAVTEGVEGYTERA